jgi:hypothetical protein
MQSVFAELEGSPLTKRMRYGRQIRAQSGKQAAGQRAYGKRSGGPDADSADNAFGKAVVARIVALPTAGASYRAICLAWDAAGFRPRRAALWSPMVVRRMAERGGR